MRYRLSALSILLVFAIAFLGCEGNTGPAGPPGQDATLSEFTYIGGSGEACLHCHAPIVHTWSSTLHEEAFRSLSSASNLYCLQCHTTGWDSEVVFGDTVIAPGNYGPDVNGYDDYVNLDTEEANARRPVLEGVQCESCHGPMGQSFPAHAPLISFATFKDTLTGEWDSLCYPCHEGQLEEWETSGHGTVTGSLEEFNEEHYVINSSCDYCHTSEGFIRNNDPAYLSYSFPEEQTFIGCPTCHDPHLGEAGGGNQAQLRNLGPVEVSYDPATDPGEDDRPQMDGYGTAQVCAQCHHARRDEENVFGQMTNGSSHFGPHGSPQMDMFIGAGCYEIPGYSYDGDGIHKNVVQNACVECHMVREELIHGELQDHSFHTFAPEPGNCEPCHSNLPDFNYKNAQTDTKALMDQLAVLLGYTDSDDFLTNWNADNKAAPLWERQAAYGLVFVANDGSMGVHNLTYSTSLLENSIAFATANQALARRD